jgi:hypothetical protein
MFIANIYIYIYNYLVIYVIKEENKDIGDHFFFFPGYIGQGKPPSTSPHFEDGTQGKP